MTIDIIRCKSCGARIIWARSVKGRIMPVDVAPSSDGNLFLFPPTQGQEAWEVRSARASEGVRPELRVLEAIRAGLERHKAHFATCPHADEHRRKRA